MASNLLDIVTQHRQEERIDEEKLRQICLHRSIFYHFGISWEEFCGIPDQKQLQMLKKVYFDLKPILKDSTAQAQIDSGISAAIKNCSSMTMTESYWKRQRQVAVDGFCRPIW